MPQTVDLGGGETLREVAEFDAWAERRFSPRVLDVLADYHDPLTSFGARGAPRRGNHRWYYYQVHHARLAVYRGSRVLNAACGIGELSLYLAHLGMEVSAFDFSPASVEAARELARINGVGDRITVDLADVRELPYDDGSFDLVTGEDSLHHLIKYPGSLESLYRVLRPGGEALFCENFAFDPLIRLLRPLNWRRLGYFGEHSLEADDLNYLRRVFDDVRVSHRSVLYTYSRLFPRPNPLSRCFGRMLRRLDDALLPRIAWLRQHYSLGFLELARSR